MGELKRKGERKGKGEEGRREAQLEKTVCREGRRGK